MTCAPQLLIHYFIIFFFGSLNVWTISFKFILFLFVYKYSYLFVHELHTCVFHQNKWHKWLIFVQRGRIFPTFSYLLLFFFLFTHHTIKHICSHMLFDSLPFVAVPILHCCYAINLFLILPLQTNAGRRSWYFDFFLFDVFASTWGELGDGWIII